MSHQCHKWVTPWQSQHSVARAKNAYCSAGNAPPQSIANCCGNDAPLCIAGSNTICQHLVLETTLPHECIVWWSVGEWTHLWPSGKNSHLSQHEGPCIHCPCSWALPSWIERFSLCHTQREGCNLCVTGLSVKHFGERFQRSMLIDWDRWKTWAPVTRASPQRVSKASRWVQPLLRKGFAKGCTAI